MKVLVTGAAGFVGGNVVRALLEHGHSVKAMVYKRTKALDGLPVEIIEADILQPKGLEKMLESCDAVIHTAGKISINGDPDGSVFRTNIEGVKNLVNASIKSGIQRFVHFSSIHAFKEEGLEKVDENAPPADHHSFMYDQSKQSGQLEILEGVKQGLNAVILNPTAIYGPFDFRPSLSGQMLIDFFTGKIPMLTPGGYNFVDVRDVSQAAVNALTMGGIGEKYLLGNRWISVKDMASMCSEVSRTPVPKFTSPIWAAKLGLPFIHLMSKINGQPPLYTSESLHILELGKNIDDNKAVRELGLQKRAPIETIRDSFRWFKEVGMV